MLIHRESPEPFQAVGEWIVWKTCLRQIAFGLSGWPSRPQIMERDQVFEGTDAYKFCLEVVSGLRSKVVGETEVFGQFRDLFLNTQYPQNPWGAFLSKFTKHVLSDVKSVRQNHLLSLGSQSYGSYARRTLKGAQVINILGAGNLVEGMLPWLQKETALLNIFCRDPEKARKIMKPAERLAIHGLDQQNSYSGGLIIAAPLKSSQIQDRIGSGAVDKIVDFRETCQTDPLLTTIPLFTLHDFFAEFELTQRELERKVGLALESIRILAHNRTQDAIEFRPFGWDDLCG